MREKILFIFLVLIFPLSVYADGIKLTCPSEVTTGSEFTCNVTGTSSTNISSLSANIDVPSELKFLAFIPASKWQGDGENGEIALYSADEFTGNFEIGKLKFQVLGNEKTTITIEKAKFYADKDSFPLDDNSIEILIKEQTSTANDSVANDTETPTKSEEIIYSAYLIDIIIDKYNLDFNKETFDYNLKIGDEDTLDIKPILEDNSSKFEILGNKDLKNGTKISIVVTDLNGNNNKYTIKIEKENNFNKGNYSLIFIIIIGILLVINILRIVFRNKKKSKVGETI